MRLRKIMLLSFLSSLLVLMNCEEKIELEDLIGAYAEGTFSATRNGVNWEAYGFIDHSVQFPSTYVIGSNRYNKQFFLRESLSFQYLDAVKARQELYPVIFSFDRAADTTRFSYTTMIDDGDVIGDVYQVVREGHENWIQFTEFDPENRRLKGRFELHLILAEEELGRVPEPGAEPTIDFVDGTFDVLAPVGFVFE